MADFNDDPRCQRCSIILAEHGSLYGVEGPTEKRKIYACENDHCSHYGVLCIYPLKGTGE